MRRNILWAIGFLIYAGGLAFAQEPVQTREDSSPAPTQEEGKMTWNDLVEEHKTFMEGQQEENKAWREDFRGRWDQAIEQCKSSGINPGACHQQYLKDLRQEAKDYHQQQKQERQQHHKDMAESRQEHIQEWKESHPGVNPPGAAGGPEAGPEFKGPPVNVMDRREDFRDRREDVRDRREDVRDRVSPGVPPRVIRDAAQHPDAAKQLYQDAKEHPEAARKVYRAAENHPEATKKAYHAADNHPGKASSAAGQRRRK